MEERGWNRCAGVQKKSRWNELSKQARWGYARHESRQLPCRVPYRQHTSRNKGAFRVWPLDAAHGVQHVLPIELEPIHL